MCLHPHAVPPVPDGTARAAFRKGHLFMRMRDEFGTIYTDDAFAALFPSRGQSTESPWRLALVTVMQYVEGLSDVQAADTVHGHIDWKYALSLELGDPGFDASVLSEFRTRLVAGGAGEKLFDLLAGNPLGVLRPLLAETEVRHIRKLAGSRHEPGDWIVRARMIVRSWERKRTIAIAHDLSCHPQRIRERILRFNAEGVDGLGD